MQVPDVPKQGLYRRRQPSGPFPVSRCWETQPGSYKKWLPLSYLIFSLVALRSRQYVPYVLVDGADRAEYLCLSSVSPGCHLIYRGPNHNDFAQYYAELCQLGDVWYVSRVTSTLSR